MSAVGGRRALLVNWLDLDRESEAEFDLWHNREHAHERIGIPGFRRCRRYVSTEPLPGGGPGCLIVYDGDGPEAFASAAYAARLDDPTPATLRVVPRLRNVRRAILAVQDERRFGTGGWLATATFDHHHTPFDAAPVMNDLFGDPAVVAILVGQADTDATDIKGATAEGRRTDSAGVAFSHCLIVEASRREAMDQACVHLETALGGLRPQIARFQLTFVLEASTRKG